MEFNAGYAWDKVAEMQKMIISSLPNLVLAAIVFSFLLFLGRMSRRLIHHFTSKQKRHCNLALIFERLAYGLSVLIAVFVSLSIVIPSFKAVDLINLLGIGGVAFGFAFKDILQNFLSGILILLTEPFKIGDAIRVKDMEGVVEDIQTRATFIKTWDGQRIVIPNTELFINSVTVQTAYDVIRKECNVRIHYRADAKKAVQVITDKLKALEGMELEPGPSVFVTDLAESFVNIRVYWWMNQKKIGAFTSIDRVMTTVKDALAESEIEIAYPKRELAIEGVPELLTNGKIDPNVDVNAGEAPKHSATAKPTGWS